MKFGTSKLFALLAFLALTPSVGFAQACVGAPVRDGQVALVAGIGFPEEATSYGGSLRSNFAGPMSGAVSYSMTSIEDVDPKLHNMAMEIAYEIPSNSLSMCPVMGMGYGRIADDDEKAHTLTIPVGVGLGMDLPLGPKSTLVPHVVPQLLWYRTSYDGTFGDVSDSDTEFGTLIGMTLGLRRVFLRGSVWLTTIDDSEPTFETSIGITF